MNGKTFMLKPVKIESATNFPLAPRGLNLSTSHISDMLYNLLDALHMHSMQKNYVRNDQLQLELSDELQPAALGAN
jgi:hypothetical protein